jgi:hypothetical protein
METTLKAIELEGTVDEYHQLQLDALLPIAGPKRVRVIVLYTPADEWDEREWLHAATLSPAFGFLKDPAENIYGPLDGEPLHDEA